MTDITAYFNRQDILTETAKQIAKDFGMVELAIQLPPDIASYPVLFEAVFISIDKLVQDRSDKFHSLLYRIDISEEQVKKTFAMTKDQSFSHVITELILKREAEKVIMRKRYSK